MCRRSPQQQHSATATSTMTTPSTPTTPTTTPLTLNNSTNATSPNNACRQNCWFPLHFSVAINDQGELGIQTENSVSKTDQEECPSSTVIDSANASAILETTSSVTTLTIASDADNSATSITAKLTNHQQQTSFSTTMSTTTTAIESDLYREYSLHSVVCQVDDGHQKNLVSLINVDERYFRIKMMNNSTKCQSEDEIPKNQWFIFNDFW